MLRQTSGRGAMSELRYTACTIDTYHVHPDSHLQADGYWKHTAVTVYVITDEKGICLAMTATEDKARTLLTELKQQPQRVAALVAHARKRMSATAYVARAYGHRH